MTTEIFKAYNPIVAQAEQREVVPQNSIILDATIVVPSERRFSTLPIRRAAVNLFVPGQEQAGGTKVLTTDRELNPLKPSDLDWTKGWIDRYGSKREAWQKTAVRVTDSAIVDPEGFRDYVLRADPDEQQRIVELLTLTEDGGVDTAPLAFAGILAYYYRPHDEEGPLFEARRRQFLSTFSLPFPADRIGRANLERALGIFFSHAEEDEGTREAIKGDNDKLIQYNLMELLSRGTNTTLATENPNVFAALGGRRSLTMQNMINLRELPSTPIPEIARPTA